MELRPHTISTPILPLAQYNPFHIIFGEIQYVIAAMRLNRRWSKVESPLLQGFIDLSLKLQNEITKESNFESFDPLEYLKPFLEVVTSPQTSGPITGVVLLSLIKFLELFIHRGSKNVGKVINDIVLSVCHCKFEATDHDSDEVILSKILHVLVTCAKNSSGALLTDNLILEMIQTAYQMVITTRLSELLRCSAESALFEIIQTVFLRLTREPPQIPEKEEEEEEEKEKEKKKFTNCLGVRFEEGTEPLSYVCLAKILKFLASVISPLQKDAPLDVGDEVRFLGLNILDGIITTCIESLQVIPSLLIIIQHDLMKAMLGMMETRQLSILALLLRVFFNLFVTCRQHLRLPLEAFLKMVTFQLNEGEDDISIVSNAKIDHFVLINEKGVPPLDPSFLKSTERKELLLECLLRLCNIPEFLAEVYGNYDCELFCLNISQELGKVLAKIACLVDMSSTSETQPPTTKIFTSVNHIAFECILSLLFNLCKRSECAITGLRPDIVETLRKQKQKKENWAEAVASFNKRPQLGIDFLEKHRLFDDQTKSLDPLQVVFFLRSAPQLHKQKVGDYISKKAEFNKKVCEEYIQSFGLSRQGFLQVFREFIQSFRLPTDSNYINRILEIFGEVYVSKVKSHPFRNAVACYVLTYSIIILNVDQHNPEVKRKMTLDQFIRNNRGVNDGNDFPEDFLVSIYQDIKARELRNPLEFPTGRAFLDDLSFADLVYRTNRVSPYVSSIDSKIDRDLILELWPFFFSTLDEFIESSTNFSFAKRIFKGYLAIVSVLDRFGLSELLDNICISLCKFSGLIHTPHSSEDNIRTRIVAFGRDAKAKLATETLFLIIANYGNYIREAWTPILSCIVAFFSFDLLSELQNAHPTFYFEWIEKDVNCGRKPPIPLSQLKQTPEKRTSLLSYLFGGSLISISSPGPTNAPHPEELAAMDLAKEVVDSCHINDFLQNTKLIHQKALVFFVKALLLGFAPTNLKPILRPLMHDSSDENSRATNKTLITPAKTPRASDVATTESPPEIPVMNEKNALFCIDTLYKILLVNKSRAVEVWPLVHAHFSLVLVTPAQEYATIVQHAIITIFQLTFDFFSMEDMQPRLISTLQILLQAPPLVLRRTIELICMGATKLINLHSTALLAHPAGVTTVFQILRICASMPKTCGLALEAIASFIGSYPGTITAECLNDPRGTHFFKEAISVLITGPDDTAFTTGHTTPDFEKEIEACKLHSLELLASLFHSVLFSFDSNDEQASPDLELVQLAWRFAWKPIFSTFSTMSLDHCQKIRNHAMTHLQRALLSPNLSILAVEDWNKCIQEVLFPLMTNLLRPASEFLPFIDMDDLDETRLRAAVVLSKVFLQHLNTLSQLPSFPTLWENILTFIEQFMKADASELLAESLPELLKNILLVMAAWGHFTPSYPEIWNPTWTMIDTLCPFLKNDLLQRITFEQKKFNQENQVEQNETSTQDKISEEKGDDIIQKEDNIQPKDIGKEDSKKGGKGTTIDI